MGLYKRGRSWYIDYYYPPGRGGKRIRERVGPEKDEARILLAERLQDIRQGRNPALRKISPKPFREAVREYLEKHASTRRHFDTFKKRTDLFIKYFGARTLQDVTPAVIQDFIAARLASGISKATANRDRSMLHGLFSFAIRQGIYGGSNPVHAIKPFPESPGRLRFLSEDETNGLIEVAARHLKPIILCALHTGARHSEVLSLRWQDVDLTQGIVHFARESTKSGKGRLVPMTALLRDTLRKRRTSRLQGGDGRDYVFTWRGRRISSVRTAFLKARDDAKLDAEVGFHTLRHTFASWFVMNGGDLYRLQKYLGHSTIALTQRYAHLSPEYLKGGVEFIRAPRPSKGRSHTVDTSDSVP